MSDKQLKRLAARIEKEYGLPADSQTVQDACAKAIELASDPVFCAASLILGVAGDPPCGESEEEEVDIEVLGGSEGTTEDDEVLNEKNDRW